MARLARLAVGGWPHLVVQRVHAGQQLARDDQDRAALLAALRDAARAANVAIHAYSIDDQCLLLLATPPEAGALSTMMQAFGRRYVAIHNRRHGRTGSLWAERFRATVVEPARYVLPCMAYVELHPLGALAADAVGPLAGGWAARVADDRWSSGAHHLGRRADPLVSDPPQYWALGNTPFDREGAYRQLLDEGLPQVQVASIGAALHKAWALGDAAFVAELEKASERRLAPLPRGRPRKSEPKAKDANETEPNLLCP
jgi:putative transposase